MKIKRLWAGASAFLLAMLLWGAPMTLQAGADSGSPSIQAETAVLIDIDSGQILLEKGMNKKMYPASLTKIMTALLAIEKGDPSDVVTMSREAVFSLPYGTSHIALTNDEQLPLLDALYATMLPSANDAANGIAEHIGGSMEAFAEMMNQRAADIGAVNTHFVNPSGLPEDDHYTTAYDMALITMEAMKDPLFNQIWGTVQYTMDPTNIQSKPRYLWNQTGLMVNNGYYYDACVGGKLGWTTESKHTLSAVAQRDGRRLLVVLMKGQVMANNFRDAARLFDYGFDNFTQYTIDAGDLEQPTPVPVYRDGNLAGKMEFATRPITLLLADGVLPHEVTAVYQLPEKVEYGQQPSASVTYTLPAHVQGQYSTVGTQNLLLVGQELINATGNTPAPQKDPATLKAEIQTPIWTMIVMVVCFGLSSILMTLRIHTGRTLRMRK